MEILDAQVHTWAPDSPLHPWDKSYAHSGPVARANLDRNSGQEMTHPTLVASMDAVGVDAAIIVTPSLYGYDNRYPLEAAARYPGRFGVVGRTDPAAPDLAERVRSWRSQPGMLALRSVVTSDAHVRELREGVLDRLFAAAEEANVPLCTFWPRFLPELREVVERYPRLQFVVDHLGLPQPPLMRTDPDLWHDLPLLLALAAYPNVALKITGAPTLSREAFPYADLWPRLHPLIEAFGLRRVMWGTDFTRVAGLLDYAQGVSWMRDTREVSEADKEWLMGRTARTIFRW